MGRVPPADEKAAIEAYVASLRVKRLFFRLLGIGAEGLWKANRYFVSCGGNPICRLTYTGKPGKEWACDLYWPSRDYYGADPTGLVFPARGDVRVAMRAIKTALYAHEYPTVETRR